MIPKILKMMNLKHNLLFVVYVMIGVAVLTGCKLKQEKVLYDKQALFDTSLWVVEQQPGGSVSFTDEGIEIKDSSGCSVWFTPEIEGPVMIEYKMTAIDNGGPYDRVSDMNVFWMASDPHNKNHFFCKAQPRSGQFRQYDKLELYYVGCGGHNNTRTRFRRYNGTNLRPLEPEHDLSSPDVLLTPNHTYTVQLVADGNTVKYIRDGRVIFEIADPQPYTRGRFGLRVYKSHQLLSDLKIISLNP